MADGRHIENRFWLYIGAILADLCKFRNGVEWGCSHVIICRYRSLDENGSFRKFKMADGRHFENSFISISQPRIIRFRSNWYADANFHSEDGYL